MSMQDCFVGRKGYGSKVKKLRYEQDRFDSTGLSNCRWVLVVLVLSCGTSGTCKRLDALDFWADAFFSIRVVSELLRLLSCYHLSFPVDPSNE